MVELYVGMYSCLWFSPIKKLFWKTSLTPPRYLAICRASQAFFLTQSRHLLDTWWIDRESFCILDSSSHLLDRSSFCSWISSLLLDSFLDTLAIEDLILDNFLDTSRYLSCRALLKLLYISQSWFFSHFFDLSTIVPLPNTLLFTPNLFLKDSSSFFKFLFTW